MQKLSNAVQTPKASSCGSHSTYFNTVAIALMRAFCQQLNA